MTSGIKSARLTGKPFSKVYMCVSVYFEQDSFRLKHSTRTRTHMITICNSDIAYTNRNSSCLTSTLNYLKRDVGKAKHTRGREHEIALIVKLNCPSKYLLRSKHPYEHSLCTCLIQPGITNCWVGRHKELKEASWLVQSSEVLVMAIHLLFYQIVDIVIFADSVVNVIAKNQTVHRV